MIIWVNLSSFPRFAWELELQMIIWVSLWGRLALRRREEGLQMIV